MFRSQFLLPYFWSETLATPLTGLIALAPLHL
jgi:hypothetical protein